MQTIARSMADTGPMGGPIHATCTPDCRPIRKTPAQPNATPPASDVHDLIGSPRAPLRAAPMETAQHVVRLWHARAGRLRCVAADGLGHYSVLEAAIIIDPLPICLALSVGRTGLRRRDDVADRRRDRALGCRRGKRRTFCTIGRGERVA